MFTTKYKSHSPTLKSIFGVTQIITKVYQVTKFNQIITICTISMSDLFTQSKRLGMCIMSNILIAKCDVYHNLLQKKIRFYLLSPYRSQWCIKGQNICTHGVICCILINFIMLHDYFQKSKQINILTPPQGSRVSVRA